MPLSVLQASQADLLGLHRTERQAVILLAKMFGLLQVFLTQIESHVLEHLWAISCWSGISCRGRVKEKAALCIPTKLNPETLTSYKQNSFLSYIACVYQSQGESFLWGFWREGLLL